MPLQTFEGPVEQIKFFPDFKEIASILLKNKGKEQLREIINKALDREGDSSGTDAEPPNAQDPSLDKDSASPEEIIIDTFLNTILEKLD